MPQVKEARGPKQFAAAYCKWLRRDSKKASVDDTSFLDSYIETLTKMSRKGGIVSYLRFREATKATEATREDYLCDRSSEAPELIMWDKHAEYASEIRAHMEGLRRTHVCVLTDFHTLAANRPLTVATSALLSKPWDDMDGRAETLKSFGEAKYRQEEARVLGVEPDLLNRPTIAGEEPIFNTPLPPIPETVDES